MLWSATYRCRGLEPGDRALRRATARSSRRSRIVRVAGMTGWRAGCSGSSVAGRRKSHAASASTVLGIIRLLAFLWIRVRVVTEAVLEPPNESSHFRPPSLRR
jgi:hypothetical protein